jgi:hypothetical protein
MNILYGLKLGILALITLVQIKISKLFFCGGEPPLVMVMFVLSVIGQLKSLL